MTLGRDPGRGRTGPARWRAAGAAVALGLSLGGWSGERAAAQSPRPADPPGRSGGELLRRPARLDIDRWPLDRALIELSVRSGVLISFSPSLLPRDETVTCRCREVSVGEALERLLARTALRFGELESQVLIFPERPGLGEPVTDLARRDDSLPSQAPATTAAPATIPPPPAASPPAPAEIRVSGTVVDEATGRPLEGARVSVVGTDRVALTARGGGFSLRVGSDPAVSLRIQAVGYRAAERALEGAATDDLVLPLAPIPYTLAEIVSTATGDRSRLELGNAVSRLAVPELVRSASITTVQDLLTARSAGLTVLTDNGILGAGGRIRVRGQSSASLSNDPLIYVDGIRIEGSAPALFGTPGVGGARPSFLNHLDPSEIESIEVVKGPSAATLYGTRAANGVIRIVTRRGTPGPARWAATVEQGFTRDPGRYPDAWYSAGHDVASGQARVCLPYQQARGDCLIDRVYRRNLMEEPAYTLLKTGYRQLYGAQVSGGSAAARYFVSTELERQSGTLKMPDQQADFLRRERGTARIPDDQLDPSGLWKLNLRGNLTVGLGSRADLAVSTGYVAGTTRFAPGGDAVNNPLVSAVIGASADPNAPSPYGFVPPNQGLARRLRRGTDRLINSIQARWRPTGWIEARATAGLDYTVSTDQVDNAPGEGCVICELDRLGLRAIDRYIGRKYSVDVGISATTDLGPSVRSRTSIGAQYNRDHLFATFDRASIFPPGGGTIDAGTIRTSGEATTIGATLGTFLEEHLGFGQRLFLTGAIRIDRNSAFGNGFRSALYPKLAVSWVARENADGPGLNTVRLRGAFGASGLEPPANAAIAYYSPIAGTVGGADVPAVTVGGVGNPRLRPERSNELEVGIDAELLGHRASVEATYYYKRTSDALINRNLPPSLAATATRMENLGTVTNQGIELALRLRPIERRSLQWDVEIQASANRNRLVDLAEVPPIRGFGFGQVPGYPLYGFWFPRLESFDDRDGDGIITPDEVVVSDTAEYAGSSIPTRTVSLSSAVALPAWRLRLGWLMDYQGGRVGHNVEQLFRCSYLQICREINDPTASLEEQARAVAGAAARGAWVEDASFVKLREVSIALELPRRWARALRSRTATVALTGRNLGLIDFGWSSWDPELNTTSSDGPAFTHSEQTPPRTFLLRLSLAF